MPNQLLMDSNTSGVFKLDFNGLILWADERAAQLLGTHERALDQTSLYDILVLDGEKPIEEYLNEISDAAQLAAKGKTSLCYSRLHSADSSAPPLELSIWCLLEDPDKPFMGYINHARDIETPPGSTQEDLLGIIADLQAEFIADKGPHFVFGKALESLLQITRSEYGFIGEVLQSNDGEPYLQTQAITNIAWDEGTQAFYRQNAPSGMAFYNLETLFGHTLKTGETVIANEPASDPRRGGLPEGHPSLDRYLGIPLKIGNKFVGMAGLANRPGGYSESLVTELKPLINTLATLIAAYHQDQRQRAAETQLRIQAHELLQISETKTQFLASMSHELRTPLNSIYGFSNRLCSKLEGKIDERSYDGLQAVRRNALHLTALINDILDISKIESGRMEFAAEQVSLPILIEQARSAIRGMADEANVTIIDKTPTDAEPVTIEGDQKRCLQIVLNLVSNAIKYGNAQDVLVRSFSEEKNETSWGVIEVQDFGDGISPANKKRLFQRFAQLNRDDSLKTEGSGLGLALVFELSNGQGGHVEVDSEPGQGSTFRVRLPLSKP